MIIHQVLHWIPLGFSFINIPIFFFFFHFSSLFPSFCDNIFLYNHFIPWLMSFDSLKFLTYTLSWLLMKWWSLFRGILKGNIYLWLKKGARDSYTFTFYDKETWPYIISNHDCFISRKTNLETKFDNLRDMPFFYIFLVFSFAYTAFADFQSNGLY